MNHRKNTGHSVSSLFSLLLFGVFVLFLILMLLFSAQGILSWHRMIQLFFPALRFRAWDRSNLSDYQIPAARPRR